MRYFPSEFNWDPRAFELQLHPRVSESQSVFEEDRAKAQTADKTAGFRPISDKPLPIAAGARLLNAHYTERRTIIESRSTISHSTRVDGTEYSPRRMQESLCTGSIYSQRPVHHYAMTKWQ
jgi:hypothetical protein